MPGTNGQISSWGAVLAGAAPNPIRRRHFGQGVAVSTARASWTLLGSLSSIGVGLVPGSLALVAFAAVGLFDCASDDVLVVRFRLERSGLRADSQLTAIGAVLAAVTVAGIVATDQLGWWWADSIAALAIATAAFVLSMTSLRAA